MIFTDKERHVIKSAFRAALCEISAQGDEYKEWVKHGYTSFCCFINDNGFPELSIKMALDGELKDYFYHRLMLAAKNEYTLGWSLYADNNKRKMTKELEAAKARYKIWKSELERVKREYRKALDKRVALENHLNDEFIPDQ